MKFKLKFPRFFRSTKSTTKKIDFVEYLENMLYIESLILLFEKKDNGTNELLKQTVKNYLAQNGNDYEKAKKQLFSDLELQVEIFIEGSVTSLHAIKTKPNRKTTQKQIIPSIQES